MLKRKFYLYVLFVAILNIFPANAQIDYQMITGANYKFVDTVAKKTAQELASESYGILEKEIKPEEYIVGAGDEFTIVLELSTLSKDRPAKIKNRISPDGQLLIDGVGAVHISGLTLVEAYSLIREKVSHIYKNFDVALSDIRKFKVHISGPGVKSCVVPATAVDRVSDVVERAGGLKDSASVRNIILLRDNGNHRQMVDLLKFYLLGDNTSNPYLEGGDKIIVPLISEKQIISIQGDVPSPREMEFAAGDSLSTLVRLGLGFYESSLLDSVEYVQWTPSGLITTFLDLTSWRNIMLSNAKPTNDFALNIGDRVYIRTKSDWQKVHYAIILGEVNYPGKYSIEKDVAKVSDLIKRAGGFTKDADVSNIEFIRQAELKRKDTEMERLYKTLPSEMSKSEMRYFQSRVREKRGGMSIDFTKIIEDVNSDDNITLLSLDSIIVLPKTDFVNVQGKVVNPGFVKFKSEYNYMDYINAAGGFAFRADESETTINKKRGGEQFLASKTNRYTIEPGDNISVPPETEITFMEAATTVLTILSPVISMIAVIVAISK